MEDLGNCDRCKRPLIEIDHYGERLVGRVECNRWGWLEGDGLSMLPEEDLRAADSGLLAIGLDFCGGTDISSLHQKPGSHLGRARP